MNRTAKLIVVMLIVLLAMSLIFIDALPNVRKHKPPAIAFSSPGLPLRYPTTGPYMVEMSPMGKVTFKHVPVRIVTEDPNYDDMLVAVRHQRGVIDSGHPNSRFDEYYKQIPRVDTGFADDHLKSVPGGNLLDKETLYTLHADVHHIDPVKLAHTHGWSVEDVQEIANNVGPFFANRYSRTNDYQGPEPYTYYSTWELAEKIGEVYQDVNRVAQLKTVYDQMLVLIWLKLPPVEKRPKVGLIGYSGSGFLPYSMGKGFDSDQYRAVGAVDAFASLKDSTYSAGGANSGGTTLDIEGMLSIDPDILISPFSVLPSRKKSFELLFALKDDPLAGRIKAFKNNRIYPGGTPLQGPLMLLFQTEMAAKQIYPEIFGEYHDDQQYTHLEQLFSRDRVTTILNAPGNSR